MKLFILTIQASIKLFILTIQTLHLMNQLTLIHSFKQNVGLLEDFFRMIEAFEILLQIFDIFHHMANSLILTLDFSLQIILSSQLHNLVNIIRHNLSSLHALFRSLIEFELQLFIDLIQLLQFIIYTGQLSLMLLFHL
jgi:hypothetical protein